MEVMRPASPLVHSYSSLNDTPFHSTARRNPPETSHRPSLLHANDCHASQCASNWASTGKFVAVASWINTDPPRPTASFPPSGDNATASTGWYEGGNAASCTGTRASSSSSAASFQTAPPLIQS